jgi:hypothetical protein
MLKLSSPRTFVAMRALQIDSSWLPGCSISRIPLVPTEELRDPYRRFSSY